MEYRGAPDVDQCVLKATTDSQREEVQRKDTLPSKHQCVLSLQASFLSFIEAAFSD